MMSMEISLFNTGTISMAQSNLSQETNKNYIKIPSHIPQVNLQEQGRLLRQEEFLVWQGRRKCLRRIFLFEDLLLFTKSKRSSSGHDAYVYKGSIQNIRYGADWKPGWQSLQVSIGLIPVEMVMQEIKQLFNMVYTTLWHFQTFRTLKLHFKCCILKYHWVTQVHTYHLYGCDTLRCKMCYNVCM